MFIDGPARAVHYRHFCLSLFPQLWLSDTPSCDEIQGLKLPRGREVNISQFADDNTCIGYNNYGICKVLEVFELFGRASGAKLNKTKSKGLWLRFSERACQSI